MFKLSILLASLLPLFSWVTGWDTEIILEEPLGRTTTLKIPWRDAKRLDLFFREMMISEPLAYTLSGHKPLSFACYQNRGTSVSSLLIKNLRLIRGWKVWQKYKHHFENERIQFWEEKSPFVDGVTWLMIADRHLCKEVLPAFSGKIPTHSELDLGILLGFGRGNASLYSQRRNVRPLPKLPIICGSDFSRMQFTLQPLSMANLLLPVFVGDPNSEESLQLKQKYLEARNKIQRFYRTRDFLSATLSLYNSGSKLLEEDV